MCIGEQFVDCVKHYTLHLTTLWSIDKHTSYRGSMFNPTTSSLESDFIIGILSGVLTLASLSLAIFGFVYTTFAQIMSEVSIEKPPSIAYDLRTLAKWTIVLACIASFIVLLCVTWIYLPSQILLAFVAGSL